MDGRILTEQKDAVTIVTISSPEVRNALSALPDEILASRGAIGSNFLITR
ncbi:MAG: hypothetical protein AB7F76_17565 [Parvibaculaceae bacterium]